jgi:hypothetical protein
VSASSAPQTPAAAAAASCTQLGGGGALGGGRTTAHETISPDRLIQWGSHVIVSDGHFRPARSTRLMTTTNETKRLQAAIEITATIYQLIAAHGAEGVPSGYLYAQTMAAFSGLGAYEACLGILLRAGMIRREGLLLVVVPVG